MFVQTQPTPNPNVLKFLPGQPVLGKNRFLSLTDPLEAEQLSPLGARLFFIDGVESLLLGNDFISVTKTEQADWDILKPLLLEAVIDHYSQAQPIVFATKDDHSPSDPQVLDESLPVEDRIHILLEQRIQPALMRDGGSILLERFEDGVAYMSFQGACVGCAGSVMTLRHIVEGMLCHFIPEVHQVTALNMPDEEEMLMGGFV